jgi:APA family basic amino acid/polyamine antiporter
MFFAYVGFDAVSTAAQEAKNPKRDLPIGILGSLAICTVIYILVAGVLIGLVPYQSLNVPDPLAVGIDSTGLTWLSPVIKVSALFGLFSTMLVQLLGQTRIFYSMSRDGLLPIGLLAELVSIGTLLAFVLACLGVIILRRTAPELPRPFRTPGMPWVPIGGALVCLVQMVALPGATWIRLIVWLAAGFAIYFLYGARRARELRAATLAAAD